MNRTISGASIALLMGSMACSKQAEDTTANNAGTTEEESPADTASDGDSEQTTEEEKEYAWTDQDNPRCGHPPTDVGDNHFVCMSGNSCKAIGICKTEFNSCACYNSCKGKALWLVKTKEECEDPGGKVVKELG